MPPAPRRQDAASSDEARRLSDLAEVCREGVAVCAEASDRSADPGSQRRYGLLQRRYAFAVAAFRRVSTEHCGDPVPRPPSDRVRLALEGTRPTQRTETDCWRRVRELETLTEQVFDEALHEQLPPATRKVIAHQYERLSAGFSGGS